MRDAGRRRVRVRPVVPAVELRVVELRAVELRSAVVSADGAFVVAFRPAARVEVFVGVLAARAVGAFWCAGVGFAAGVVAVADAAVFVFRAVVALRVEAALALRVEVGLAVLARAGPPPAARSLLDVRRAGATLVSSWRRVDAPARLSVGSAGPPVMLPAW